MSAQPNHSLIDGLRCLQALAEAQEPLGGRELARRLGMHPVRCNRLLMSLAGGGFAAQDAKKRYLPGNGLHVLAASALSGSALLRRSLPHLLELARDLRVVVALGVRWRDQVWYLWFGTADDGVSGSAGPKLHPARTSSIGQVLLAQDAAELAHPDHGAALALIAQQGHACLRHGSANQPHLSIAVPVGTPAYAGLAVTSVPVDVSVARMVTRLRTAAMRIDAG